MTTYARYYRTELQEIDNPARRLSLRFCLTLAALVDRAPRFMSWILAALSVFAAFYILLYYNFTTNS